MSQSSESIHSLVLRLAAMHSKPLFGRREFDAEIVRILDAISANPALEALWGVPAFLIDPSDDLRRSASRAVHQLMSRLHLDLLIHPSCIPNWSWGWYHSDAWRSLEPSRLASLCNDPATDTSILGLASLHQNGYVRQEAVRLLALVRTGGELPYLLVRQSDWVPAVSQDACAAVRERLSDDYLPHFIANLALVVHLLAFRRYDHSDVVQRIVEILIQEKHDSILRTVIRETGRKVRREIVRVALEAPGLHRSRVIAHGLSSNDATIRLRCARFVRISRPSDLTPKIVATLQHDSFMPVRREVLLIEAEAHPENVQKIWESSLLDSNSSLRELAQFYCRKLNPHHPAEFYRQTLARNPEMLTAVGGLSQSANQSDIPFLRSCLRSPRPGIRREAVRGLARIAGDSAVPELIVCVRDDSPAVVREAHRQLRSRSHLLNAANLLTIVTQDQRQHVRRAALMLIFEMGKSEGLPGLIRAAIHSDSKIAELARSHIATWFTGARCNRVFTVTTDSQKTAIQAALAESHRELPAAFRKQLNYWLENI